MVLKSTKYHTEGKYCRHSACSYYVKSAHIIIRGVQNYVGRVHIIIKVLIIIVKSVYVYQRCSYNYNVIGVHIIVICAFTQLYTAIYNIHRCICRYIYIYVKMLKVLVQLTINMLLQL